MGERRVAGDFRPDLRFHVLILRHERLNFIRYLSGLQSLGGRSVRYHDAWEIAGEGPGYTWNVDNPNARSEIKMIVRQPHHRRRVDYLFVGCWDAHPKAVCEIQAASLAFDRPLDGIWASDHFGVVADLEVRADQSNL